MWKSFWQKDIFMPLEKLGLIYIGTPRHFKFKKKHFIGKQATLQRKEEGSDFQLVYAELAAGDAALEEHILGESEALAVAAVYERARRALV